MLAVLDTRKAFDRVNHYKLFNELPNYDIPVSIVLFAIGMGSFLLRLDGMVAFSPSSVLVVVSCRVKLSMVAFCMLMTLFYFPLSKWSTGYAECLLHDEC